MLVEICIDRFESARAARLGGADRVEVCAALEVGGLTPGLGLVERCVKLGDLGVMVMIRPHAGGFDYRDDDWHTMLRDLAAVKQLGVQGVVFGALTSEGQIDRRRCEQFLAAARPLEVTFHRAFDLTADPLAALEDLIDLGVDRILTSGQAPTAWEGRALIRRLVDRAENRISIMPGAGVNPTNVADLVRATEVVEVHGSASQPETSLDPARTRSTRATEATASLTPAHSNEPEPHSRSTDDDAPRLDFVHPTRLTRTEMVRALVDAARDATVVGGPERNGDVPR